MLTASASDRDPVGRSLTVPAGEVGSAAHPSGLPCDANTGVDGHGVAGVAVVRARFPNDSRSPTQCRFDRVLAAKTGSLPPPPGCLNPVLTLPRTTSNT